MPQIPDHPYKIFIISGSESRKTNTLFNLISHQPDIGKIYLYAKDRHEGKYQLLINKLECAGWKYCKDSKAFIEYSNDMDDIYENIERIQSKQSTQNVDCIWRYDCWHA